MQVSLPIIRPMITCRRVILMLSKLNCIPKSDRIRSFYTESAYWKTHFVNIWLFKKKIGHEKKYKPMLPTLLRTDRQTNKQTGDGIYINNFQKRDFFRSTSIHHCVRLQIQLCGRTKRYNYFHLSSLPNNIDFFL